MFERLPASLNIAFKWLPMFDLDQTFSSNILLHERMCDRLAASTNKPSAGGKSNQSETQSVRRRCIMSAVINRKRYVGSLCSMFDQTLFACLATPCCLRENTMLDKSVCSFSGGFNINLKIHKINKTIIHTAKRYLRP